MPGRPKVLVGGDRETPDLFEEPLAGGYPSSHCVMTKTAFGQGLFLTIGPPALAQGAAAVRGIVKKVVEWFSWLNIALART